MNGWGNYKREGLPGKGGILKLDAGSRREGANIGGESWRATSTVAGLALWNRSCKYDQSFFKRFQSYLQGVRVRHEYLTFSGFSVMKIVINLFFNVSIAKEIPSFF